MCSLLSLVVVLLPVLAAGTAAVPHAAANPEPKSKGGTPLSSFAPTLSNGTHRLPPPPPLTVLRTLAIGRGTQNYTCAAGSPRNPPVAAGALATLFDASALLALLPAAEREQALALLPGILLSYPEAEVRSWGLLPVAGRHYFTAGGTPVFDLPQGAVLEGVKRGGVAAPRRGSEEGAHGAVDWLALGRTVGGGSRGGVEGGYRVWTAGGAAPATCEGVGEGEGVEVEYAAQYLFYGGA